jgi:membrane fusion protein (multidrug efflux system)
MNRPLVIYIIFFALLFQISCSKKKNASNAVTASPVSKGPLPVEGFIIRPQRLSNEVRTTGTILAFEEVELHPEVNGRIIRILFNEGSSVNKGDLLVKLYDEDLRAQLRKTISQIGLSQQQLNRQQELLKTNATSQQEYDIASNQLNSLKADEEVIRSAIGKTEIRAPFKGVIGLRYVSEGSYVTPASKIAVMQNIDPVKIDFSIPEKYATEVEKGDEVSFTNEESGQEFKGKVYAIEPRIEEATRTLKVRAICSNSQRKIVPGSFVKVELQLKEINDALMVPSQSLLPVLKGQNIYIVENGMSKAVSVKTGIRTPSDVQITEGLSPGDTILTKGIISLKPGQPVQVKIADR